jgi:hypothetical protein
MGNAFKGIKLSYSWNNKQDLLKIVTGSKKKKIEKIDRR